MVLDLTQQKHRLVAQAFGQSLARRRRLIVDKRPISANESHNVLLHRPMRQRGDLVFDSLETKLAKKPNDGLSMLGIFSKSCELDHTVVAAFGPNGRSEQSRVF